MVKSKIGNGVDAYDGLDYLIPPPTYVPLGSINAVTTTPPAGATAGQFWINSGTGTIIAGWGAPVAGIAVAPGDQLMMTVGGTWNLIKTSDLTGSARSSDLAATSGAGLIGWIQNGAAAVARTLLDKLREPPQSVRDRGAATNGTTDARAAFVACDAIGPFTVPPGLYFIASNLTITNNVAFQPGARLVIVPTGVIVTFNGAISAEGSARSSI